MSCWRGAGRCGTCTARPRPQCGRRGRKGPLGGVRCRSASRSITRGCMCWTLTVSCCRWGCRASCSLAGGGGPAVIWAAPGARMYRTGDLVRRVAGGDIEFLGRVDTQLKVRGYRIEAGEIESVLVEHPDVAQAVVAAHEHGAGDTRLTAYVIPADPAVPPQPEGLRAYLRAKLPDYMVPVAYVTLAIFPTTPNNKIDRARLPRPDAGVVAVARSSPPRPGLEAELAGIWERVLGVHGIGRDDDFFDLGGHSLLAVRVFARVEALTGRRAPLSTLFRAPTIARFAELLEADDG